MHGRLSFSFRMKSNALGFFFGSRTTPRSVKVGNSFPLRKNFALPSLKTSLSGTSLAGSTCLPAMSMDCTSQVPSSFARSALASSSPAAASATSTPTVSIADCQCIEHLRVGWSVQNDEAALWLGDRGRQSPHWNRAAHSAMLLRRLTALVEHLPGQIAAALPGGAFGPGQEDFALGVDGERGVLAA